MATNGRNIDVTVRAKNETKTGLAGAANDIKTFGEDVKSALVRPFDVIKGVVAVEAVRWFKELAVASVESAAQADAAWGLVETAVGNVGVTFGRVRGDLDALFNSIQKTTRFADDEATEAFATLVRVSGDYRGA